MSGPLTAESTLVVVASKTHVISVVPDGKEMSFFSIAYNLVSPTKLMRTDEPSIFWSVTTETFEAAPAKILPLVARFGSINDVVVVAVKQTKNGTYFWGMPIDELIGWKPPKSATDVVAEDLLFSLYKLPHSDLKEVVELENTTTHPQLKAMLDKLLSHCPTFKAAKIKSASEMAARQSWGYVRMIKAALLAGEDLERKAAAAKGKAAKDKGESAGGGNDAKKKWLELTKSLVALKDENVTLPFDKRYLVLCVDLETGKPTTETTATLNTFLQGHTHGEALKKELEQLVLEGKDLRLEMGEEFYKVSPMVTKKRKGVCTYTTPHPTLLSLAP